MNQQTIKLIRKFVKYSLGTEWDVSQIKKEFKGMDWRQKTKELNKMRGILNGQ